MQENLDMRDMNYMKKAENFLDGINMINGIG